MAHRPTTPLATPAGTHASHLALVFGFTTLYLVAEVVGGLVLALLAIRFAARPATPARTYGYYRFEILAALMNSIVLMGIPVYMLYEAYQRFRHPPAVWRACTSASRVISRSHTPQCKWNHRVMGSTKRTSRPCRPVLLASVTGPQKEGATMTSLWLWPILFFLAPAQASLMRPESGGGCSPTSTSVPPSVTIACQGVDPQVLQPLNAMLATTDQDLHSNIRQAEAWVRTYHAVVQHLGADGRDHGLLQEAHILVQAGKLADAGALLDRVLASSDEAPPERLATHHFSRAELFALPFQFREALPHYAAAARLYATSPQYAYRYAVVLQQQGQYTDAEPLYRAALQALRPLVSADPTGGPGARQPGQPLPCAAALPGGGSGVSGSRHHLSAAGTDPVRDLSAGGGRHAPQRRGLL